MAQSGHCATEFRCPLSGVNPPDQTPVNVAAGRNRSSALPGPSDHRSGTSAQASRNSPKIAVGVARYRLWHHLLHFLCHDANVCLVAAVVAEAVQAEPVGQAINKDDVVLEPDIRALSAATTATEATTSTTKTTTSTAKTATAKSAAPDPKTAGLCS